jgi:AraC-type transcriptional regulator N-terminus
LPCLSIIAQGAKTVIVGQEVYEYNASRMLVYSVALPVATQVTQASHSEPYFSLRLDLDPQKIAEWSARRNQAQRQRQFQRESSIAWSMEVLHEL